MKKLEEIRTKCQEAVEERDSLLDQMSNSGTNFDIEREETRADFAEEILEILNGESK